jgi:hypothetical protein
MAATFDIRVDAGATYRTQFTVGEQSGDAEVYQWDGEDISTITMTIREPVSGWVTDVPLTVSAEGIVSVHLPPATTARFRRGTQYTYAIDVTKVTGDVTRILRGVVSANA